MKILYVITGADIGGAQRHLLYQSEWFKQKGFEVHVVVGEEGPFISELSDRNIPVSIVPIPRTIKLWKDFKALCSLTRFIKNGKFNIVHSHSSKAGIIARIAGFLNKVDKNIFTAHGFVFTDPTLSKKKRLFYLLLERIFSWISTHIITVSHYDLAQGKEFKISVEKMHVIHNGIPKNAIISYPDWKNKQEMLRNKEKWIIGFVGRFASEKNIDMLLRVAEKFKEQTLDQVEFWMIGDGPLFEKYEAEIKSRNLQTIIQLKGNQDNVQEWMDHMHAMIITSHKEGLPFVLLEACSRGLPVISTDVGGVKEVVDPLGTKNILVPINDDNKMYAHLTALLSNHSYREELGEYFLNLANLFTVDQMCKETEKVYFS